MEGPWGKRGNYSFPQSNHSHLGCPRVFQPVCTHPGPSTSGIPGHRPPSMFMSLHPQPPCGCRNNSTKKRFFKKTEESVGVRCNPIQLLDGYKVRRPVPAWQLHYSGYRVVSPPPTLYTLQQHLHGCLLLFFKLFRLILFVFVADVAEEMGVGIAIGLGAGHQSLPQPSPPPPPLHQTGSRG